VFCGLLTGGERGTTMNFHRCWWAFGTVRGMWRWWMDSWIGPQGVRGSRQI